MDYVEAVKVARGCGFTAPAVMDRYVYSLHNYGNYSIWPTRVNNHPSWNLLLSTRGIVVKLLNKKKSLGKVYFSLFYQGEQQRFYVKVLSFTGWYPHQHDNGVVCIGNNDELFQEFARDDLGFALLNLKNALTRIDPTSVIRVDRRFAYSCKRCSSLDVARRWTLEPVKYGNSYVCESCYRILTRRNYR